MARCNPLAFHRIDTLVLPPGMGGEVHWPVLDQCATRLEEGERALFSFSANEGMLPMRDVFGFNANADGTQVHTGAVAKGARECTLLWVGSRGKLLQLMQGLGDRRVLVVWIDPSEAVQYDPPFFCLLLPSHCCFLIQT